MQGDHHHSHQKITFRFGRITNRIAGGVYLGGWIGTGSASERAVCAYGSG
jgi:hypothetical protein